MDKESYSKFKTGRTSVSVADNFTRGVQPKVEILKNFPKKKKTL